MEKNMYYKTLIKKNYQQFNKKYYLFVKKK